MASTRARAAALALTSALALMIAGCSTDQPATTATSPAPPPTTATTPETPTDTSTETSATPTDTMTGGPTDTMTETTTGGPTDTMTDTSTQGTTGATTTGPTSPPATTGGPSGPIGPPTSGPAASPGATGQSIEVQGRVITPYPATLPFPSGLTLGTVSSDPGGSTIVGTTNDAAALVAFANREWPQAGFRVKYSDAGTVLWEGHGWYGALFSSPNNQNVTLTVRMATPPPAATVTAVPTTTSS